MSRLDLTGEEIWLDKELFLVLAEEMDRDAWTEELAASSRLFWAREILVEKAVQRIDYARK